MSFGTYSVDPSVNPQPPQPFPDPYAQPQPNHYYAVALPPPPPPPNAEPYPRLTVEQKDWSPSRQCFIGQCKVVAKIEGSSLPDYQCRAVYTLTYVPLAGWTQCSAPCPDGPVIIDSRVLQVSWDANGGDRPVIEAKTLIENHWKIEGVAAHGPCELLVTCAEGSDLPNYSCPAIYTLKCDPLEGWLEIYDTHSAADQPTVAKNGAGSTVANSKVKEQGTFAATCEDSRKTGRINDLKSFSTYGFGTSFFPLANSHSQKESASVPKSCIGQMGNLPTLYADSPTCNVSQVRHTTGDRVVYQPVNNPVRKYADTNVPSNVEDHVDYGNVVAKIESKFLKPNMDVKTCPVTESSHEISKTCALQQNKVSQQSSPNRSKDDDELTRLSKLLDRFKFYENEFLAAKQRLDTLESVAKNLSSCIIAATQKPETSDSNFNMAEAKESLKSNALDMDAGTVKPKHFEKLPAFVVSECQLLRTNTRGDVISVFDLKESQDLCAGSEVISAVEDKQREAETDSSHEKTDSEYQVIGNQGSSDEITSDEDSSKEDDESFDEEEEESSECDSNNYNQDDDSSEWDTVSC